MYVPHAPIHMSDHDEEEIRLSTLCRIGLIQLLKDQRWSDVYDLLQTPWGQSMTATCRDEYQNTSLHIALGYQAPEEIQLRILHMYPTACQLSATEDGWIPLYVAAMWGCSTNVMEQLILSYPEGLDQQEYIKGRTPRYFSTRFAHNQPLLQRSTSDWKIQQQQQQQQVKEQAIGITLNGTTCNPDKDESDDATKSIWSGTMMMTPGTIESTYYHHMTNKRQKL